MSKIARSCRVGRSLVGACVLGLLVVTGSVVTASRADDEEIPYNTKLDIEGSLQKRVNDLLNEKNEHGDRYKRGTYAHLFRKVDDSTVEVNFYQDEIVGDRLKSELYLLTLKRAGETEWNIIDEQIKETYDGLVRTVPNDEKFYQFDTFDFDLEGLSITGSKGSYVTDYLDGKPVGFTVAADDLSYEYEPPAEAGTYPREVLAYFTATEPDDFIFEPEYANVSCSPQECERILSSAFKGSREVSIGEIDPDLKKAYEEYTKDQKQSRNDDAFSGFQRPFDPDRRLCNVGIKRKGIRDHYVGMNYDNWDGWDVSYGASGYGAVLAYYSKETRTSAASEGDLERRTESFLRDYKLTGIEGTLELALEDAETMKGDLTLTLLAKQPLRELPFFIARPSGRDGAQYKDPDLVLNSIREEDGDELLWVRTGPASGLVILHEEVPAGSEIKIRLQLENKGAVYKLTPSYSRLAREGWLPFVNVVGLIDKCDLTVKVPAKYTTIGLGTKTMEKTEGDVSITRWVAESPVWFPTVIFGEYEERESRVEAKKSDGTLIPVVIHADTHGMQAWDIRGKQLIPLADMAANSLNLYREIYGVDYPFSKLDLVNDPMGMQYGQSPASIVYLGSLVFRGEGVLGDSEATKFNDSVVAHEVGHQWFGNMITNANRRNYWFVESLSEYSSALYVEAVNTKEGTDKGWKAYIDHVDGWRHNILDSNMFGSVLGAGSLNVGGRTAAIYNKGPYAFHMMRTIFGAEKMDAFLKTLGTELAGKEIVTSDIQNVAEMSFEGDMDWFFDQWIRGAGIPEFSFRYSAKRTEDGSYLVQGVVKQRVVVGKEKHPVPDVYYRNVGHITVTDRDGTEYPPIRFIVEGAETPFQFKIPKEPLEVVFNKHGEVLAHDVLTNRDF